MDENPSDTTRWETLCGSLYITQSYDKNGRHSEVLIEMGKAGGCSKAWLQAIAGLISLVFKLDGSYMDVVEILKDIQCPSPFIHQGEKFTSCIDAIAGIYEEKREVADNVSKGV
jgi:hypothetical protein